MPYRTRLVVLLALLMLLAPLLPHAEEVRVDQPLAWFALRNFHRLEQRLKEFATLTKVPGLAYLALGVLQVQFAGLSGLDRQRPIRLVVPALDAHHRAQLALVLPYTEKGDMLSMLRKFFPRITIQAGILHFQGGPIPVFGRLDESSAVLIVSRTREILQGFETSLPADVFATASQSAPDMALQVDVGAFKQRHRRAWQAVIEELEDGRREPLLRQFLDDLSRLDSRLTLAPDGWVYELETQMQPGSTMAAFLNHQSGQPARAASVFPAKAAMRLGYALQMTDEVRQQLATLLHQGRDAAETRLAGETTLTPVQHTAGAAGIAKGFQFFDQWLARPHLEMAAEMDVQSASDLEITGWVSLADSARGLNELLDALKQLLTAIDNRVTFTSPVMHHRNTPLHRIDAAAPKTVGNIPDRVFLAAQGDFLVFHAGDSPEPLTRLLDRIQERAAPVPTRTNSILHMELSGGRLLTMAMDVAESIDANTLSSQAALVRLLRGAEEPLHIDILTRKDAFTLRCLLPASLIQNGAEALGQQIMAQIGKTLWGR